MIQFHRMSLLAGLLALIATPTFAKPAKHGDDLAAANAQSVRQSSDADRVGALTVFTFEKGALYAIKAAPQRITDIALETGETILSISAGDTARWIVGDAHSGEGETSRAHVLIKPNAAGLTTNLVLMTDRRAYHLELSSLEDAAMAEVSWRYPASLVETLANPPLAHHPKAAISPTKFNLDYTITGGRTPWRPIG
ncbi:MAG: P-type conjugative transfer protein TrbG, partial [Alphaproteobacteria bacterium]|nr:P-type conjugative transfer protein TrbG [Alphaproteobacteria bacterium]